ncbi:enoyl-CoA hydratase [Bacillus sp. RG28]|uniref:Enoyl-CoA hydratase n=1 Tax=Gottfriedia endophytica TaxID=2820819 RepID=A0A940NH76_9BACI|nr:MaoC/PaaZ C-terminal domain-containing protein [Gottfriedia endophytica]MBP0723972.1 enoyl-CoA hydratase [Gottfriedia endophytica]
MKIGDVLTWERTFTEEDILQFAEISGDKGRHHLEKNENGQLMVHGLLTASIGTKIGGDMNYIARTMNNEFLRPVYTGDTIKCEITITDIVKEVGFSRYSLQLAYFNQKGKEVLIGTSQGIIRE